MAYNLLILKKLAAILLFSALPALPVSLTAAGQQPDSVGTSHLVLIMPFENASNVPGIDWVGEAFPEVLSSRLNSDSLFVINRSDRLRAFDELGIPLVAKPSRATIYQIAQQMDADYVLMGRYNFDGNTFIATAQILDMTQLHLSPELTESGPLTSLIKIQTAVAWDVLSNLKLTSAPKDLYVGAFPPLRLDALENYVRGVLAGNAAEKIKRFKEAIRLEPTHTLAILHLGKIYYGSRDFEQAVTWLSKVPDNDGSANEAHFYLGLAAYYSNQMDTAEAAFRWLASRLPLTEVYNNLGVVVARRGERRARGYFEKSVQTDPNDPDYRFNLAVELHRDGDTQGAVRQLRDLLALQPDADARAFLDSIAEAQPTPPHLPLERIKVNYDESPFRQLSMEISNLGESRLQKLDPASHAAFHVQRGRQLLEQGMPGEAENEFRGAILLNPANPEAHAALAGVLESLQDNTGARNEARVSLTLAPSPEAYMVLARLDLAEKNAAGAQQNVERALALDPANSTAASLKQDIVAALSGKAPSRP
ncbi:MAG TPA: tetratricopeptide repeat protein [Verrucomicrobiae bacterium]|nr:tetratricopeptide repeat protein [Verrucomicrobiae bacterium]